MSYAVAVIWKEVPAEMGEGTGEIRIEFSLEMMFSVTVAGLPLAKTVIETGPVGAHIDAFEIINVPAENDPEEGEIVPVFTDRVAVPPYEVTAFPNES